MTISNDIQTVAGATVSIATTDSVATNDLAGFTAKTYVTIGEVTNLGEFGKTYAKVEHKPIGTRYTRKLRGSYDNGKLTLEYAYNGSNAGQLQLRTALASDKSWAVKIVFQGGDEFYFTVKILSAPIKAGGVDTIVSGTADLEIDSDIVYN